MSGTGGQKRVSAFISEPFYGWVACDRGTKAFLKQYIDKPTNQNLSFKKALVYLNDIQSDELRKIA